MTPAGGVEGGWGSYQKTNTGRNPYNWAAS
jgi:hypothetical protein